MSSIRDLREDLKALRSKAAPSARRQSYLVGLRPGETREQALEREGVPAEATTGVDAMVIFLIPGGAGRRA